MQVVIPMSGFGERFRRAGYTVPKPLVHLEGRAIIEHVVDMFPGEADFIFICNRDHLANPDWELESILSAAAPAGRIVDIEPHKLGPVHALLQAADQIAADVPAVVNYCDFTCFWDWQWFKRFVRESECSGAIPAYRGFHPHSLGTTNYAYISERNGWVTDIREKEPFTDDRMSEYASSGTYYFASGGLLKDACAFAVAEELTVGGEFYVSLVYRYLLDQDLPVAVYPLQHFMQWGTPEDVSEYEEWSGYFRALIGDAALPEPVPGALVIPMAGLGQRFRDAGFARPKPALPVSGMPMVVQAANDVAATGPAAFVVREDMEELPVLEDVLTTAFPDAVLARVPASTEGQAISARIGLDALEAGVGRLTGPVTFAACDTGFIASTSAAMSRLLDGDLDLLVWVARGHASAVRAPEMFGWVAEEDGLISHVSVKAPLDDPATDPIVTGTFTFRSADQARECIDRLVSSGDRVNGEYYLDSCVNHALALGYKCATLEVEYHVSWGTPNDLRTFEYWQSCFHKWHGHPYRLGGDRRVPTPAVGEMDARYAAWSPPIPAGPVR